MGTGALARPGGAKLRSSIWFAVSNAILSSLFESCAHTFRGRGRPRHTIPALLHQPVVLLQHFAQTIVGQADDLEIVNPLHRLGRDHGIDYRFFRGLNGGEENRIQPLVGKHRQLVQTLRSLDAGVGG